MVYVVYVQWQSMAWHIAGGAPPLANEVWPWSPLCLFPAAPMHQAALAGGSDARAAHHEAMAEVGCELHVQIGENGTRDSI